MIFYFSGTGNTQSLAARIAESQKTELCPLARELDKAPDALNYTLQEDELLGFAFPVYAWGPPRIVLDFIRQIKISGGRPYVFALSVCGGEDGLSVRILQKALAKKHLVLDSAFTLIMPNNYLIGIDVDTEAVAGQKLKLADDQLAAINRVLLARERGVFDLHPGPLPGLKSYLINPFFNRFALRTRSFHATDRCTGCQLCQQICPVHAITVDGKPSWRKNCTFCLACLNSCPAGAIEYGRMTAGRARYLHPDLQKERWTGRHQVDSGLPDSQSEEPDG